ncbi:hypothetical protein DICPUDRAFT_80682 [Dictyostelium purpureum]|uniref:Cleavage and polyadenylation specificity factor subunit 2 n=1 Tax=Dictyostelium purpureum TaxID=5786 RepID=F0ZR78_DICPU|nr:uncharacterized protein DICPUDRAFT_80682 [Dictyostelium purpureum]EGC33550.1 hypothetical protein DICPUDRAFT_80682 [Dictyostelium purpureum]|eukprot:XP_003289932.1 hypothetical protein DICPUDRAFT_80682 [Dictyostelium purpureum]
MGSIVKFTALSGGDNEKPPCYLLEIDDFCILLDCGLSYDLDFSLLEPLKKYADKIDAVLLSNSDLLHIGGLPYAVGKLGLTGTIYGTTPVLKMGTMFLYDLYENKMAQEEFDQFNLDNVDACFGEDRFKELSFSQHYLLQGKGKGISITPYLAGHMVGSSVWRITKGTYSIIYALDFNHRNEGHLDSLQLTSDILKPSLLITDSKGVDRTLPYKKIATRDQALLEKIHNSLRAGGNVLLPVDTAGRVLELLLCIENYWVKNRLSLYTVGFLGRFSFNVCQFAKSQLEFMSSSASVRFEQKIDNPFTFRQIKIFSTLEEIPETNTPKVILTSSQDLETGYSRDLFIKWSSDPKNLILFTNYIPEGSLASKVINIASNKSSGSNKTIEIQQGSRVPLQGEELLEYEQRIAKEKEEKLLEQLKKEQEEQEERERLEMEEKGMNLDDNNDEIMITNGVNEPSLPNGTIINDSLSNFKNPFENKYDLSRGQFRREGMVAMFPYYEKHVKWGDYGEEDEEFIEKNQNQKVEEVAMEEDEENEQEVPKKIVVTTHQCEVNCKVDTIDYEGISDGRSIKTIIQQIAPTNLVLIRGKKDQSKNIENYVKENMRTKGIFSPAINEELDLTSGTNVYELVLRDTLVNTLKPSKILDCEVSFIQGKVEYNPENNSSYLDIIPSEQNNGHDESFIGDIKLADLKQVLVKAGIKKVQFDQGIINCNDLVYIWREDVGGNSIINVDGIISDEYYLVKELLYRQFQIV